MKSLTNFQYLTTFFSLIRLNFILTGTSTKKTGEKKFKTRTSKALTQSKLELKENIQQEIEAIPEKMNVIKNFKDRLEQGIYEMKINFFFVTMV